MKEGRGWRRSVGLAVGWRKNRDELGDLAGNRKGKGKKMQTSCWSKIVRGKKKKNWGEDLKAGVRIMKYVK